VKNEPTVEIADQNGSVHQFSKGLVYKTEGTSLKSGGIILIVALLIGVLLVFMTDPPKKARDSTSFETPQTGTPQQTVDVPQATPPEERPPKADPKNKAADDGPPRISPALKLHGPQLIKRPHAANIPPGSTVHAILVTGASNGSGIKARVTESLEVGGETFIEEGSILLGTGQSTDRRLFIQFTQLVSKDGFADPVRAQAEDPEDSIVGIRGSNIGAQGTKLAAGIGLNFAGGLSEGLQDADIEQGVAYRKPSIKNALLNGAARAALDQSRQMMSDVQNAQPLIEIPAGTKFTVTFEGT